MELAVGDRVQIVDGGLDVTNGTTAVGGKRYGEGGPLWATISAITTEYHTYGRYGLPSTITKITCTDNNLIVWQVREEDIADNVIHASDPSLVQTEPTVVESEYPNTEAGNSDLNNEDAIQYVDATPSTDEYATVVGSNTWVTGTPTGKKNTIGLPSTDGIKTKLVGRSTMGDPRTVSHQRVVVSNPGVKGVAVDQDLLKTKFSTVWEDITKRNELLNEDTLAHRNYNGYPYTDSTMASKGTKVRKYDFQIIPGDERYAKMKTLESKLRDFRASVGLPVHGNNELARSMKYFMYNRFRVPDPNLAHNRSVTYVFFSRPDLNILTGSLQPTQQCLNHTESVLTWQRYPELFKLLVDAKRIGDENNFNLLLSNQVTSFEIRDEELETIDVGKSWREYAVPYGIAYTGRNAGEFSCNFTETSDYSVINLIKLWITYIDNVASGAWSPSYDLYSSTDIIGNGETYDMNHPGDIVTVNDAASSINSHVFSKTLDYAASVYVFKCGPDGETVLYWSKYYGVFPVNTGAAALTWDNGTPIGNAPNPSIRFRYAWKKDNSPISLLEFNDLAFIRDNDAVSENSFNRNINQSSRPFVGTPFIEIDPGTPRLTPLGVANQKRTVIRLKFKPTTIGTLTDDNLYRSTLVGRYAR